ncbi:MAG: hypothetical protein KDA33_02140 [Phycisphaerales bacterium]|nr:hypothetical protein [Phycisphaerales bacterium]
MSMRQSTQFIVIGFAVLHAAPNGSFADEPTGDAAGADRHIEEARRAYDGRLLQIQNEIQSLSEEHPWAGEYYWGDGLGGNYSLAVAPRGGFAFRQTGCLGVYDQQSGALRLCEDGSLQLIFRISDSSTATETTREVVLIPVQWGRRCYLIERERILDFWAATRAGVTEPRREPHGRYYLRRGDERKPAKGAPTLPERLRNYGLVAPIHASVTEVIGSEVDVDKYGRRTLRTRVRIDAGASDGLLAGMVMELVEPKPRTPVLARIVVSNEHMSEGVVDQRIAHEDTTDVGEPIAGWRLVAGQRSAELIVISGAPRVFRDLNLAAALRVAAREKMVVLAFFRADWGAESAAFEHRVLRDAGVREWVAANCVAVEINATTGRPPEADRYNVTKYPTTLLLDSAGAELGRFKELPSPMQFVADAGKMIPTKTN